MLRVYYAKDGSKQFIRFFNGRNSSFLALRRLSPDEGFEAPTLLCNNDHRFLVKEELEQAGIALCAITLEPVTRNTAAAIAVAALSISRLDLCDTFERAADDRSRALIRRLRRALAGQ